MDWLHDLLIDELPKSRLRRVQSLLLDLDQRRPVIVAALARVTDALGDEVEDETPPVDVEPAPAEPIGVVAEPETALG
jgi:hypothetical protein